MGEGGHEVLTLHDYVRVLSRRKWVIAATTLLVTLLAVLLAAALGPGLLEAQGVSRSHMYDKYQVSASGTLPSPTSCASSGARSPYFGRSSTARRGSSRCG